MSTAKRPKRRQAEARSASPLPVSKKLKTSTTSHVPTKSGLDFLVDEDARVGRKLEARLTNGVSGTKKNRVDESHALVAPDTRDDDEENDPVNGQPPEVIDISSAEEESSEYESSEDEQEGTAVMQKQPVANGHMSESEDESEDEDDEDAQLGVEDDRMQDVQEQEPGEAVDGVSEEPEEPSFGQLLQARHPGPIDVRASLPDHAAKRTAVVPVSSNRALTATSGTSLSTVLTQALKTNDKDMLESCFQVTDLPSLRSTIERLQPQLAATLLQRLAERIHKAPGRTGYLMIWIQWTLVTHGGYLSSQPEAMARLKSLAQVVRERASGLQSLLHLKGKLDLLSAQLEYRKNMQAASRAADAEDDEDEDAVVYVEGQDDDWSEDENKAMVDDVEARLLELPPPKAKGQLATPKSDVDPEEEDDDDESEDGMPNGVAQEADDESDEDDAEDGEDNGLIEEEAEETSDDDDEEASSDEDTSSAPSSEDDDSEPSDAESEPEVKRPPPKTLNRKR